MPERFDVPIEALLRRRVTGGFIVAVLLTVFLSVVSWRSARRADQDAYWVSHTHEVMETIQRTTRHVIEVETSLFPMQLLGRVRDIERSMGRDRQERWGPRVTRSIRTGSGSTRSA